MQVERNRQLLALRALLEPSRPSTTARPIKVERGGDFIRKVFDYWRRPNLLTRMQRESTGATPTLAPSTRYTPHVLPVLARVSHTLLPRSQYCIIIQARATGTVGMHGYLNYLESKEKGTCYVCACLAVCLHV